MIEGDKLIQEAITAQIPLMLIVATDLWIGANKSILPNSAEVIVAEDFQIKKTSAFQSPQEVIAIAGQLETQTPNYKNWNEWILCLDHIQDPGNLGTIIRSADWFGIKKILCSQDCADMYNPKVVQASMGSIFRVDVFYDQLAGVLPQIALLKYAATLSGNSIKKTPFKNQGVLIIGNETHGISKEIITLSDVEITIPKNGQAESLNAAVACSIILSYLK